VLGCCVRICVPTFRFVNVNADCDGARGDKGAFLCRVQSWTPVIALELDLMVWNANGHAHGWKEEVCRPIILADAAGKVRFRSSIVDSL